jgi:hypothetical protein
VTGTFRSGAERLASRLLDARVLVACLIGFYVLLPLDRGFPRLLLFGRPLNAAIAATVCVFFILIVQTRGTILRYLREPYGIIQSLYAGALFVGALRAPSPPSALHWSLLYYCTFVLNFVILRHVTRGYGTRWLSTIVVGLGLAAAAVGVMQVVIEMPLPMYDAWYESYFKRSPSDYTLASSRATGTMSNPILYCVLMALVIPYALDVKNGVGRAVALFSIMFAAGLSGSRTGVFVVAAFAAGAFVVYRWRAVRALPAVGLGLVLLLASLSWLTPGGQDSRLALLGERLSFMADRSAVDAVTVAPGGASSAMSPAVPASVAVDRSPDESRAVSPNPPSRSQVSAALGVSLRRGVVVEATREMTQEWGALTWMIGRGSFTAAFVGTRIQSWYNTVDNVFLSVLYERGLLGLVLFTGAFVSLLIATRRVARETLHWFAPVALAVAGLSFCWDAYSMFNILAVGSMAITMARFEQSCVADDRRATIGAGITSPSVDLRPGQES